MHRLALAALLIALSGCGLSSVMIKADALSFGDVIEDATNKLLVLNLLRARDKAPLHFADIPVIRESVQQTVSISFLQFMGSVKPTATTDSQTVGANLQLTPSFEVSHLYSKEFITGIASPIDPRVVKYWLDRGLDRRIVLLLFFSAVEIVETRLDGGAVHTIRIANAPREAADIISNRRQGFSGPDALRCDTQSDFERYLKLFNMLRTFSANSYRERRLLARGMSPGAAEDSKNLQAFAALDQAKVQLVYDREQRSYNVYSLGAEPKVAFCFHEDEPTGAASSSQFEVLDIGGPAPGNKTSCFQSVVDVAADDGPRRTSIPLPTFFAGPAEVKEPSRYCSIYNQFTGSGAAARPDGRSKLELRLYIRSVGEIFQFLGDLLHYQDAVKKHLERNAHLGLKLNTPVTFGYCGDHPEPGCDDIFLRLDGEPCNARFSLNYRDKTYHVGNFNPPDPLDGACQAERAGRKDHTLEVLAVLHQLVGLNKSATDIKATPAVQLLP